MNADTEMGFPGVEQGDRAARARSRRRLRLSPTSRLSAPACSSPPGDAIVADDDGVVVCAARARWCERRSTPRSPAKPTRGAKREARLPACSELDSTRCGAPGQGRAALHRLNAVAVTPTRVPLRGASASSAWRGRAGSSPRTAAAPASPSPPDLKASTSGRAAHCEHVGARRAARRFRAPARGADRDRERASPPSQAVTGGAGLRAQQCGTAPGSSTSTRRRPASNKRRGGRRRCRRALCRGAVHDLGAALSHRCAACSARRPHAGGAAAAAGDVGFAASVASDGLSVASATKTPQRDDQGPEAMVIESFTAARYYGVEDAVIASLQEPSPASTGRSRRTTSSSA